MPVYQAQSMDVVLFASAARTATVNGSAVKVPEGQSAVVVAKLAVSAQSGTSPTLDVKLQDSEDGTTFADIADGAFTQVGAATPTAHRVVLKDRLRSYIRGVATIAGTSPSYTFALTATVLG